MFEDAGDPNRFSDWADDPRTPDLVEQSPRLVRESKSDAELVSPHGPEEPGAYDDARLKVAWDAWGRRMARLVKS